MLFFVFFVGLSHDESRLEGEEDKVWLGATWEGLASRWLRVGKAYKSWRARYGDNSTFFSSSFFSLRL
jgi:hypothetical protein